MIWLVLITLAGGAGLAWLLDRELNPRDGPRRAVVTVTIHADIGPFLAALERIRRTNLDRSTTMKTITTQMTLGHLRTALAAADPDARVEFEDGKAPNCIGSYRMNYSELAIGVDGGGSTEETEVWGYAGYPGDSGAHSIRIVADATVAELVKALNLAELTEFEGYKGGTYEMRDTTPLSRAEHGDPGDVIVGVDTTDPEVVRILVLTEDPPGISQQTSDLPDVEVAAERVGEFLRHFGDGLVDSASGRPLYARDLEALRKSVAP